MTLPESGNGAIGLERWWSLALITAAVFLNYLDRYILGILIGPIKAEFYLTDSQIGLLMGVAFASFYSGLAIPVARLAERFNRVVILSAGVTIWSLGTAACGAAANYVHLFLSRLVVGCGESGVVPCSHSMVADLFPPERRAGAMALLALSSSFAVAAAPLIGGILNDSLGWRWTLIAVGAPGVLLAVALIVFLKEPRRGASDHVIDLSMGPPEFRVTLLHLWQRRAFRLLFVAFTLMSMAEYALFTWLAPFFDRALHLSTDQLGRKLFFFQGLPYVIGTLAGGFVVDRLYASSRRWLLWVPMVSATAAACTLLALCFTANGQVALLLLTLPSFAMGAYVGPSFAAVQGLAGVRSRATAIAMQAFTANLIGAGLGPWLIGILSDALEATYREASLRYSFLLVVVLYLVSALALMDGARHLEAGLDDARRESGEGRSVLFTAAST